MPSDPDAERRILDEIDLLVDESLARGDQSDSFHGEQLRETQPCPWCIQPWHFLKITVEMENMRRGSYARDEFGQGIMDPDYRHDEDDSIILCPGSEYHGPPEIINGAKVWDKQGRERAQEIARRQGWVRNRTDPGPSLPPGRLRRIRFYGPFNRWTVGLEDDRTIEEIVSDPASVGLPGPVLRIPTVVEQRLTATFDLNEFLRPTPDLNAFIRDNQPDIVQYHINEDGYGFDMKPVVMPFRSFQVFSETADQLEPTWIEFETTYQIERHPWFCQLWVWSGVETNPVLRPLPDEPEGFESDYAIIDEVHEFGPNNERLHSYVEQVRNQARIYAAATEAPSELQRRQEILQRRAQNSPRQDRQVAADSRARAHEEAPGATHAGSEEAAVEAGAPRSAQDDADWFDRHTEWLDSEGYGDSPHD